MKKTILVLVLILGLTSMGLAETSKKQVAAQDGFQIKPKLFWSTISPLVIRPFSLDNYRVGLTVIGLDCALMRYKNFYFLAVGAGLQTYQKGVFGWHSYYDYYGYQRWYQGIGYRFFFRPYLKFVPIKYRWEWASKILKMDSYFEIGITHKKDIVIGLTFSGNPFKKKAKKK